MFDVKVYDTPYEDFANNGLSVVFESIDKEETLFLIGFCMEHGKCITVSKSTSLCGAMCGEDTCDIDAHS